MLGVEKLRGSNDATQVLNPELWVLSLDVRAAEEISVC